MKYYLNYKNNEVIGYSNCLNISKEFECREVSKDEYDKYVFIFNQKEENIIKISELKQNLLNTDYQAIKYAEGELTEEEYAPIKAKRKEWRVEINRLEEELNNGK